MAARAVISILDGLATPVAHSFSPCSGDGNVPGVSVIEYEDRVGGITVGFNRIHIATRKPTPNNKNHKVTITVKRPTLEVLSNSTVSGIAPAPVPAYDVVFKGEFTLPQRSDLAARRDLLAYVRNLLAHITVTQAIIDLEAPW